MATSRMRCLSVTPEPLAGCFALKQGSRVCTHDDDDFIDGSSMALDITFRDGRTAVLVRQQKNLQISPRLDVLEALRSVARWWSTVHRQNVFSLRNVARATRPFRIQPLREALRWGSMPGYPGEQRNTSPDTSTPGVTEMARDLGSADVTPFAG